jgi:cell division transport system ATP-binding protein
MIELFHVTKKYSPEQAALLDITLRIEPGEFVFITGASGAGKSTLLKLLFAEERPTAGQVIVDGENITRIKDRRIPRLRRKLGVVFQDFKLIPHWTVAQNVAFPLQLQGGHPHDIKRRVWWALKLVRLHHKLDAFPPKISGGEQQRVAIARAIVGKPSVVLADEPTGALDAENGKAIMTLLADIAKDSSRGVLVVTHDPRIVPFASRIVHIEDGRLVREEAGGEARRVSQS